MQWINKDKTRILDTENCSFFDIVADLILTYLENKEEK